MRAPTEAISADTEPGLEARTECEKAPAWPNITVKREQPADANAFDGAADKLKQHFSPKSGQRD